MRRLLGILSFVAVSTVLCAVLMAVVILVGMGAGYCLHRLVPDIDLGLATVIGVLALFPVIYATVQVFRAVAHLTSVTSDDDDDESEYEDSEAMSDEQIEYVADQLTDAVLTKLGRTQRNRGNWSRPHPQG